MHMWDLKLQYALHSIAQHSTLQQPCDLLPPSDGPEWLPVVPDLTRSTAVPPHACAHTHAAAQPIAGKAGEVSETTCMLQLNCERGSQLWVPLLWDVSASLRLLCPVEILAFASRISCTGQLWIQQEYAVVAKQECHAWTSMGAAACIQKQRLK